MAEKKIEGESVPEKQTIHLNVDFDKKSHFIGRSVEDGLPVTLPLYDLEDLLIWKPDDPNDAGQMFSVSTVPYFGKDIPKGSTKTLVCHDMAGGYLDDRFVQGKLCTDDNWYYLAYWDVVDTFVYFSHHFVTIPPVGWINCAHTNGVAVLGTFITEGGDGFKRCEAIFSYEWVWKKVADQLVEIAKYYKFEGWLLNIENKITEEALENLKSFVKYLTVRMHDAIEGSQVIWYDSVTDDGQLMWQNELNSKNKVYFEACDGIFLNYGWDKSNLERSAETAMVLDRVEDVYVGVDVFGRGCYGGGGMNSAAAVEVIRRYNLSTALFAPGWVKEVLGSKNFEENQRKFWTKLCKYCNMHTIIRNPAKPYLSTDFNPGISVSQQQKEIRFLHLNQQALMPCLSEASFLPLKVGESVPHCVSIAGPSSETFSKTRFSILSDSLVAYATTDKHVDFMIRFSAAQTKTVRLSPHMNGVNVTVNQRTVEEIDSSIHSVYSANVKKFVISTFEVPQKLPIVPHEKVTYTINISLNLEDVTWKKDKDDDTVLLLSCSLLLCNIDLTFPTKLYLKTSESDYGNLGTACSKKYRICDLRVPSPIWHGPDMKITIKAEQISPVHPITNPDIPSRIGELIVSYGERMPEPIQMT